jgi:hypothetical protein
MTNETDETTRFELTSTIAAFRPELQELSRVVGGLVIELHAIQKHLVPVPEEGSKQ